MWELSVEDRKLLAAARERGWLDTDDGQPYQVELAWIDWCRENGQPCITVSPHERLRNRVNVQVILPPGQRLSPLGVEDVFIVLRRYLSAGHEGWTYDSHYLSFGPVRPQTLETLLPAVRALLVKDQSEARRAILSRGQYTPVEGMATCRDNSELEDLLEVGDVCYIREIPNMLGHVVVIRDGHPPRVGWHLHRFELHEAYD